MTASTRDRLIDAGERQFAEQGFEAASIRAITREAGVNVAAAHYHFGSKEALLRAVLDRYIVPLNQRRLELLDAAISEAGSQPVALDALLRVFLLPDLDWRWRFALFAVLSVASIFISRKYLKRKPIATDQPTLNRRAEQYIGREAILEEPITSGTGRIILGDGSWRVRGPDLPIGTRVKVVDSTGGRLVVEAMTSLDGDTGPAAEDPSGEP